MTPEAPDPAGYEPDCHSCDVWDQTSSFRLAADIDPLSPQARTLRREHSHGLCRLHAPIVAVVDGDCMTVWPTTRGDDWCHEHVKTPDPDDE